MREREREVCFLIGAGDEVLWSDASSSPVELPDSRARWEAIWSRREALVEIAHSHPFGPLGFSLEDATTMSALTQALGRALRFSVVAPSGVVARDEHGEDRVLTGADEPPWAKRLRNESNMKGGESG
jgi:hypothetical protein